MADKINQPSITARLDIGDLKPNVAEANKALDGLTAKSVEQLRDKSEAAVARINKTFESAVDSVGKLKSQLADNGFADPRGLKQFEQSFDRLKNLGLDSDRLSKLAGVGSEVGAKVNYTDPEVAAWKKAEEKRTAADAALQDRATRVHQILLARDEARAKKQAVIDGIHDELDAKEQEQRKQKIRSIASGQTGSSRGGVDVGGEDGFGVHEVDDLIGGKFNLKKGAKFGLGGILAGFVADTVANATDHLLEASNAGRLNNQSDLVAGLAESLPIAGGIERAFENIAELQGHAKRDANAFNDFLIDSERHLNAIASIYERRKDLNTAFSRSFADQDAANKANARGGDEGRLLSIDASLQAKRSQAEAERDARVKELSDAADAQVAVNTKESNAILDKYPAGSTQMRAIDVFRLDQLREANNDVSFRSQFAQDDVRSNTDKSIAQAEAEAERQRRTVRHEIEDTKGVEDRLQSLSDTVATMDADPIAKMRKEFDLLEPSAKHIEDIDKAIGGYKEGLGKNALVELKRASSLIGLNSRDRYFEALVNAGATGTPLDAQIRVGIDASAAIQAEADLRERLAKIGDQIGLNLARTPLESVRAQIAAEDRVTRGPQRLSPAEFGVESGIDVATSVGARLDEVFSQQAKATIENVKTPLEKLGDTFRDLQGQAKHLTPDELSRASAKALVDFETSSRPELLEVGSAAAVQALAVSSGEVFDSSNPQLALQRDANALLEALVRNSSPRTRVAIQ